MAQWIEVRARYDKMLENGATKRVTDPYLVDALTCTEAEARVIDELMPLITGELSVTSNKKTNISEIFFDADGSERYYRVKVNFITVDEQTAKEKRNASYIIVEATDFKAAYDNFIEGMKGTMADYEIESIAETRYVDVFKASAE